MKDFEKEKLQQSIKFNESRQNSKQKSKKNLILGIVLIVLAIIAVIGLLIYISINQVKMYNKKFINDLERVYNAVIEEQAKKEEDEEYVFKGITATSRSYKYEELYTYVQQKLNIKVNDDFYILDSSALEQLGLQDIEREYLVSYQNKVVFCTEPLIKDGEKIYTLDNILKSFEQKQSVDNSGANPPELFEGMTPVVYNYDINSWEIVNDTQEDTWYNYSEKMWANVMLSDYSDDNIENLDGSYFVWIPRFAYKISKSNYHTGASTTIDIKFLKGNTNETIDGTYINEKNRDATIDYVVHPTFTFGEQISGIWVSKFEGSQVDGNYKSLQDQYSWTNITLSEAFDISKEIKENEIYGFNSEEIDTHLIKNSEWGAVAYLSHSKYGKSNNEVWINVYVDETGVKTGYSGRRASESNYGNDTVYPWNSMNGVKASTTGNVYGIFDMSGGATEKVAAYIDNGSKYLKTDGKSLYEEKDSKYFDKYYLNGDDTAKNNYDNTRFICGDAIYETSSGEGGTFAWHSDTASMATGEHCFLLRGGSIIDSTKAGLFAFLGSSGGSYIYSGFRAVITENTK